MTERCTREGCDVSGTDMALGAFCRRADCPMREAERADLARRDDALDRDTEWDGDENDSDGEAWA